MEPLPTATQEQSEFAASIGVEMLVASRGLAATLLVTDGDVFSPALILATSTAAVALDLIKTVMYHPEWAVAMCLKSGFPVEKEDKTYWLSKFPVEFSNAS